MKRFPIFPQTVYTWLAVFVIFIFSSASCFAQAGTCPVNIDFELGNFQNWQCYTGSATTSGINNVITVNPTAPVAGIHTIIPRGTLTDPYGGFPISSPGGSDYSVRLGNSGTNSQAERISYTFSVPQNQTEFVLTYQYAVVLEDPGHSAAQQPRFTAKVFDITADAYITCGSFDYVATANLPGFKKTSGDVIYKDWTPVTINLYGYQGHQLRLEFTTADCTLGGHFGYAYVDVNASCKSLVTGASYCPSQTNVTLNGPGGFSQYTWYNATRTKVLGNTSQLVLNPIPAEGTVYLLDLVPYTGFGCPYSTSTTIHKLPEMVMKETDPAPVCFPTTVDLTDNSVTLGSDTDLVYTYWQDAALTTKIASPKAITTSGTYYIKGTAPSGCTDIKAVKVVVNQLPVIKITNPQTVCLLSTVDITLPAVVAGSSTALTYTYWRDTLATISLINPTSITAAGTYFIKGTNVSGCTTIKPVKVTFYALPVLVITNPAEVCYPLTVDITTSAVTFGSDANLTFTYWTDSQATVALSSPKAVPVTGTYYIKATNSNGCTLIKPVKVVVNALPILKITDPAYLCTPAKADITANAVTAGSSNYSKLTYWKDAAATVAYTTPQAVSDSGTYYIKATNNAGCEVISPVTVVIHNSPVVVITNPKKIYIPNTVDITDAAIVKKSTANLAYTYWNNATATDAVFNPKAIDKSGIYYIMGTTQYGCYDIKPVQVTVASDPMILVPKGFTPTRNENNRLYPFLVAVKTLVSFKIYNHWGNLIFQTDSADPAKGWDGLYKGQYQFMDTYTWYAEGIDYFGHYVHNSGNTILLK